MSNKLEFKKKNLVVKWEGQEYSLSFPNVADGKRFSDMIKDKTPPEVAEAILDFLDLLGLPKNVSLEMYEDDVVQIFYTLRGEKKSK